MNIRPPQCSHSRRSHVESHAHTVFFYFILFVFNFGLLSAFYMDSSLYIVCDFVVAAAAAFSVCICLAFMVTLHSISL